MRTRLIVSATLLAAAAHVPALVGQEAASSATPSASADSKVAVSKGKDTLSVDFPDEEIRNVLRNVAELFELNLVIPDTLQGKTSIKLRDVTWRQIFQVVLNPVGYTYIEDGNIIKVVTADSLNLEPLSTEVFILNYAKSSEVKPSLDALVDAKVGGKIIVDARSNALVVTERPSAIQRIRPIIQNLDRATDQVMIETKFIEVTDRDVKKIGVNWAVLDEYNVGVGKMQREYSQAGDRKGANGFSEENINDQHRQMLARRGWQFPAAKYEVKTNVPPNYPGAVLNPTPTNPNNYDAIEVTYPDAKAGDNVSKAFTDVVSRATTAVFSAEDFGLVLSALKTMNDTKLVSNPTVVTLNNTEATINVGEEYPIPNYTYNQERGSFEVSGFTYKPIGVILKVTPQVNSAGFIKLNVEPEVSQRGIPVPFGGASGAEIPVIAVRKTKTQVTLKDGYTLGIGGLVDSTRTNGETKVPLLGDIPGLGRLFRSNTSSKSQTNLLVFITARTVKPDGGTVGEIFDPRAVREMKLTKDELPGFRDGSDPFAPPTPPAGSKDKKKSK
jgi:type IV pilus assembly protein PilQ